MLLEAEFLKKIDTFSDKQRLAGAHLSEIYVTVYIAADRKDIDVSVVIKHNFYVSFNVNDDTHEKKFNTGST